MRRTSPVGGSRSSTSLSAGFIGVALLRTDDTSQSRIEGADYCLYAAKRQGVIASFARPTPRPNRANPQAAPPARVA
ncbi:MAG TPA: hypothetical protein VGI09_07425 [Pseudolabrys sp.]